MNRPVEKKRFDCGVRQQVLERCVGSIEIVPDQLWAVEITVPGSHKSRCHDVQSGCWSRRIETSCVKRSRSVAPIPIPDQPLLPEGHLLPSKLEAHCFQITSA